MDAQVKIELNPLSARSHVNAGPWTGDKYRKARRPMADATAMETRGRPLRSTYARIRGAWPCSASAAKVRVAPYMDELATERTAIIITAFSTESRPVIPADWIAIMKGEVLDSTSFLLTNWGLLYGTNSPIISIETM
jgi:hypothetical protein